MITLGRKIWLTPRHGIRVLLFLCFLVTGCSEEDSDPSQNAGSPGTRKSSFAEADPDYATSGSCANCHKEQYDSWHASYHRTMTQDVSDESIIGRFDGEETKVAGYPCRMFRRNGQYFMTVVDPVWESEQRSLNRDPTADPDPKLTTYQVDRVVGSHNQQVYLSRGQSGDFHTLPLVWHVAGDRWITRAGSFLSHSSGGLFHKTKLWNNGCIFCHNTRPRPGLITPDSPGGIYSWRSRGVETGIACEACHGPGQEHVALQSKLAQSGEQPDEQRIVSPASLSQRESLLVCARCHGKMIASKKYDRECLVEGDFFRPGEWDYTRHYDYPTFDPSAPFDESREGQYFWPDGTPRTTALEFQGVLASACFEGGQLTCLSCHSMHRSSPEDQLKFGGTQDNSVEHRNRACTQCHEEYESNLELQRHTHHDARTEASLCYNCHMPFQAYSLLKRVRSHRITRPSPVLTERFGLPNGCNQCHVDRTVAWSQSNLDEWFGPSAARISESSEEPMIVRHALSGHALQRALAIAQLGDPENFELAGSLWRSRILVELLEDSYSVNRLLAFEALKKLDEFSNWEFDYLAPVSKREKSIRQARDLWKKADTPERHKELQRVLKTTSPAETDAAIRNLISGRNNVPMGILE